MNRADDRPIKVEAISEAGYEAALLGLGLNHGLTSDVSHYDWRMGVEIDEDAWVVAILARVRSAAEHLASQDDGHNKFLESIAVWLDITAPRFWWSQFDTYRIGITKQSESTMHTLHKCKLTQDDFVEPIPSEYLRHLNDEIKSVSYAKALLPEGFLQRRIVCTNYKTLRHILKQRKGHKLPAWRMFCEEVYDTVEHPEFLKDLMA